MRAKFVNRFERGVDPKHALGLGYTAKIQKCFKDLGISDDEYEITPTGVMFNHNLDLEYKNVVWLPDGLEINGFLDLRETPITKLPNNLRIKDQSLFLSNMWQITELPNGLSVGANLYMKNTEITKLPDDLYVKCYIYVGSMQRELIAFAESSKFADLIRIS